MTNLFGYDFNFFEPKLNIFSFLSVSWKINMKKQKSNMSKRMDNIMLANELSSYLPTLPINPNWIEKNTTIGNKTINENP